jgi:glycosyltransferase involved in cell wall biosynthesis
VVYAPLYEGFGLPAVEALGYGTPLITSAIPPIMEACGTVPTYVDPVDVVAIAAAMTAVSGDDRGRSDFHSETATEFRSEHSWERSAGAHDALFVEFGMTDG